MIRLAVAAAALAAAGIGIGAAALPASLDTPTQSPTQPGSPTPTSAPKAEVYNWFPASVDSRGQAASYGATFTDVPSLTADAAFRLAWALTNAHDSGELQLKVVHESPGSVDVHYGSFTVVGMPTDKWVTLGDLPAGAQRTVKFTWHGPETAAEWRPGAVQVAARVRLPARRSGNS